jgi:hypothetical protein
MPTSKNESTPHDIRDAALAYRARGWSVIPVRPREKRPLMPWQLYQQQLPTLDEIERWYARWPEANVGIVTGALSGLVVVDVDPRHGGDDSLKTWQREHGRLPRTVEARSGGGGRHLYFAHPGGIVHNRVAFLPGVDLRGDGGLIVAPPSVHPSGRRYEWIVDPTEIALARLPAPLLAQVAPRHGGRGHATAYWRELLEEGVGEGRRNDSVASIAGHLLWRGAATEVVTELMLCWNRVRCRPPLPDDEVVRTVDSISRLHRQHATDAVH